MDDALFGKRNKRGDWAPNKVLAYPPVFVWPVQPLGFLKWLFGPGGYILSWNLFYAVVGVLLWGMRDTALSYATTEGTAEFAPNLTRVDLPGVSHWVQQDATDACNTAITRFLSERDTASAA